MTVFTFQGTGGDMDEQCGLCAMRRGDHLVKESGGKIFFVCPPGADEQRRMTVAEAVRRSAPVIRQDEAPVSDAIKRRLANIQASFEIEMKALDKARRGPADIRRQAALENVTLRQTREVIEAAARRADIPPEDLDAIVNVGAKVRAAIDASELTPTETQLNDARALYEQSVRQMLPTDIQQRRFEQVKRLERVRDRELLEVQDVRAWERVGAAAAGLRAGKAAKKKGKLTKQSASTPGNRPRRYYEE